MLGLLCIRIRRTVGTVDTPLQVLSYRHYYKMILTDFCIVNADFEQHIVGRLSHNFFDLSSGPLEFIKNIIRLCLFE